MELGKRQFVEVEKTFSAEEAKKFQSFYLFRIQIYSLVIPIVLVQIRVAQFEVPPYVCCIILTPAL